MSKTFRIENVESYIYLGQRHSTRDKHQYNENQRRITAGWKPFAKHRDIFKGNIGIILCSKRQLNNLCVITAMIYGTHHTNNEEASSFTNKYGKGHVKHHIPGLKNKHMDKEKEKGHRHD